MPIKTTPKISLTLESYQTILQQTPVSTQILSPTGETLMVNKAWEELWGITLDKLKGYNMLIDQQLVDNGIMPYIKHGFAGQIVHIPPSKYVPEKTLSIKNAVQFRWVKALMYPIKDKTGEIMVIVLQHEDITEQKEAEADQARLAAIVSFSDDAIISKNLDGIIQTWNKAAEEIFGYIAQEAIGKHITLIIPPELHYEEDTIISRVRHGEHTKHYETHRVRKDGTLINVSLTISPIRDNDGTAIGVSKIARDITERKLLEKHKDDFLGVASHELKTPVTSIKAYTQILHKRFQKAQDYKSAELVAKMDAQLNKMNSLIADLLDITKIESGRLQFTEAYFDFNELVTEIVEEVQRTTDRHTLVTQLTKTHRMYGDRERIGQVLVNLLTNAIKYSPHNEKLIISSEYNKGCITLCVEDFGVGIPEEKQSKIFDRFYRISGPREDTYPGLGLGLYISSEIIKRLGGRIWVESQEGQGSTFCFSLPVKRTPIKQQHNTLVEEELKHS